MDYHYDLSGDLHWSTIETLAFNVMELIKLDNAVSGHPIQTPHGVEHFVDVAIMYLAQLRREMRESSGRSVS